MVGELVNWGTDAGTQRNTDVSTGHHMSFATKDEPFTALPGEAGPELWGAGPRPLYWPMKEPSSLNWMSTLSPYSASESSLPSLLPLIDGWLSFSSTSLEERHAGVSIAIM
ncbi:hypothetical protein EYF80_054177 [Liparis tanakae]|uniref:Uncharacterized protein n=1 Tax=Liparis tanakae TaxID=230148 RepID=A0A4Z2F589_9TELE|nr:hypothetical protein EYF80_054177 [Liparis tanakae]